MRLRRAMPSWWAASAPRIAGGRPHGCSAPSGAATMATRLRRRATRRRGEPRERDKVKAKSHILEVERDLPSEDSHDDIFSGDDTARAHAAAVQPRRRIPRAWHGP